jgi:hypothetical protein
VPTRKRKEEGKETAGQDDSQSMIERYAPVATGQKELNFLFLSLVWAFE